MAGVGHRESVLLQAQHLVEIRRVSHVILRGRRSIWDTFVIAFAAFRCATCDVAFVFPAILRGRHSTW